MISVVNGYRVVGRRNAFVRSDRRPYRVFTFDYCIPNTVPSGEWTVQMGFTLKASGFAQYGYGLTDIDTAVNEVLYVRRVYDYAKYPYSGGRFFNYWVRPQLNARF